MITRGRKKQYGTSGVPVGLTEGLTVSDETGPEPVAKKQTRAGPPASVSASQRIRKSNVTSFHVMSRHVTSCHVKSRGTVTRPTLHCQ